MEEIKAYKANCGKKYFNKSSTRRHEKICQCWSNPALKTCLTCAFGSLTNNDDMSMEWVCDNTLFDKATQFTKAPNDLTDSLNSNCPLWEA